MLKYFSVTAISTYAFVSYMGGLRALPAPDFRRFSFSLGKYLLSKLLRTAKIRMEDSVLNTDGYP